VEERFLVGVPGVTEVWLIRHAECYDGLKDDADPPLSERGREQARRLAERLRALPVAGVYASPLLRAQETARELAPAFGTDARLVEAAGVREDGRFRPLEPFQEVADRMAAAVDDALAQHPGAARVVMVAHGRSITLYLGHVLRLDTRLRILPYFTSVSTVRAKEGVRAIGTINDVSHLEPLRGPSPGSAQ
jgi:broad specificity phosphatase PhoE